MLIAKSYRYWGAEQGESKNRYSENDRGTNVLFAGEGLIFENVSENISTIAFGPIFA